MMSTRGQTTMDSAFWNHVGKQSFPFKSLMSAILAAVFPLSENCVFRVGLEARELRKHLNIYTILL